MNKNQRLQHLYWRAGFGLSPDEWRAKKNRSTKQVVEGLFLEAHRAAKKKIEEHSLNISINEMKEAKGEAKKKLKQLVKVNLNATNVAWVMRMGNPKESALLEKMCLFWHGHFACVTKTPNLAEKQLNTFRTHALGNFREMILAIAKDPSMIRFLNNQQNKKRKPNENFARELMELFTIGRGNYSEKDVKEAARAFTGWSSNKEGEFVFRKRQHDFGQKTFMGKTGNWDGADIIDIILERRETAVFIVTKAYRFFVNEKIDEQNIKELADTFYQSNYDIEKLMRKIFESNWFYDEGNVGVKIKSPIELLAGIIRIWNARFENEKSILFIEKALGQILFKPPNVAGWAGGKSWIDNSTLMLRLNLPTIIFQNSELDFKVKEEFESLTRNTRKRRFQTNIQINPFLKLFKKVNDKKLIEEMSSFLLQAKIEISEVDLDRFIIKNNKEDLIKTICLRLMTLPEYQLC